MKIPVRYLPHRLTRKDKEKQKKMLLKSRKMYKKGVYYTRKKVDSFPQKKSNNILNAEKIYKVDKIDANKELAFKTECTLSTLKEIIRKMPRG
jgi:exo-beta-1,3-glucanase (GH17 family)